MTGPHSFSPLSWQVEPWRDTSQMILLSGSAGGGKSRLAAEKLNGFMLRYPGAVGIALRKAREHAAKSVVPALLRAAGPAARWQESKFVFQYRNGSVCYVAGMLNEDQRQALRSINGDGSVDFIWAEEANALDEDDLNELLARLRGTAASWRQIILSTNPDTPEHWIYKRIIQGHEATAYFSGAKDNPYNPPSYLHTLDLLTGPIGQRLRDGLWVGAEGMVYDRWNPLVHTIDAIQIPSSWRRVRSIDFGYTNPFVCQWWAQHPDGKLIRYRELYGTRRTVREWAVRIKELSAGEKIEVTICDHDAEDRATLVEHGISNVPAKKDIGTGIQAVLRRLAINESGTPGLVLVRKALVEADNTLLEAKRPTCTEAEITGYIWPKAGDGRPIKEVPVKVNDHGLDALRYAVMYFDGSRPGMSTPGHDDFADAPKMTPTITRDERGNLKFERKAGNPWHGL